MSRNALKLSRKSALFPYAFSAAEPNPDPTAGVIIEKLDSSFFEGGFDTHSSHYYGRRHQLRGRRSQPRRSSFPFSFRRRERDDSSDRFG
jgi:hypothetical protein